MYFIVLSGILLPQLSAAFKVFHSSLPTQFSSRRNLNILRKRKGKEVKKCEKFSEILLYRWSLKDMFWMKTSVILRIRSGVACFLTVSQILLEKVIYNIKKYNCSIRAWLEFYPAYVRVIEISNYLCISLFAAP